MKLLLSLILVLIFQHGEAAVFTAGNAADVKKICKKLQPGDTLYLADGEWHDERLVLQCDGGETRPIVVTAQHPGGVVLTGSSSLSIGGSWIIVSGLLFNGGAVRENSVVEFRTSSTRAASHCRLTECAILNYNPADKYLDYKWVSLYGKENRVDHSTFIGKKHQGTLLVVWLDSMPNNHRIDHNYFGPRPAHDRNGAEIVRVGTSEWSMHTSRTIVEYNVFEQCSGEVEIISNKSCENIYRFNTFKSCAGTLTLRHGNRCEVYGNWFFGAMAKNTGGVRIIGENHRVYDNWFQELSGGDRYAPIAVMDGVEDTPINGYFQVKNAAIRRNIFVDCRRGILFGARNTDYSNFVPADTVAVDGNIFYGTSVPLTLLSQPLMPTYTDNKVFGAALPSVTGFEKMADERPTGETLLRLLRDDGKKPVEIIPVGRERAGVSWSIN